MTSIIIRPIIITNITGIIKNNYLFDFTNHDK